MVLGVVWTRWWTHRYRRGDTWTHEVRAWERMASAVSIGCEWESCCWPSGYTNRGKIRGSYPPAFGIWAAKKRLSVVRTFEAR